MLFVWDCSALRTMTMRETAIPLDIAFVDPWGRITSIAPSVPAWHPDPIWSVAQYVIEAPAGWFAWNGIGVGSRVVIEH